MEPRCGTSVRYEQRVGMSRGLPSHKLFRFIMPLLALFGDAKNALILMVDRAREVLSAAKQGFRVQSRALVRLVENDGAFIRDFGTKGALFAKPVRPRCFGKVYKRGRD